MPVAPALFQIAEAIGEAFGRSLVAQWAAQGRLPAAPAKVAAQPARPARVKAKPAPKVKSVRAQRAPREPESVEGFKGGDVVDYTTRKGEPGIASILTADEMTGTLMLLDLRSFERVERRPSEVTLRKAAPAPVMRRRQGQATVLARPAASVEPAEPNDASGAEAADDATTDDARATDASTEDPSAMDASPAESGPPVTEAAPAKIVVIDAPAREPEPERAAPSPVDLAIAEAAARMRRNG